MQIVAFDPGVTTGVATLDDDNRMSSFETRPTDSTHPHEYLFDLLANMQPKKIIYEPFHFRQGQDGAVFMGIEYIGVMELYSQLKYVEIIKSAPGSVMSFWTDNKLKTVNLHQRGKVHANDAMRHLLAYRFKHDENFRISTLNELREAIHDR